MLPATVSAEDIANKTKFTVRHVKERLTKQPGFPKAIKIGRNREWFEKEFEQWYLAQRER